MATYVLIDVSNGDALDIRNAGKIYFWIFKSLKKALKAKKKHDRSSESGRKHYSELVGPFRWRRGDKSHGHRGGRYDVLRDLDFEDDLSAERVP